MAHGTAWRSVEIREAAPQALSGHADLPAGRRAPFGGPLLFAMHVCQHHVRLRHRACAGGDVDSVGLPLRRRYSGRIHAGGDAGAVPRGGRPRADAHVGQDGETAEGVCEGRRLPAADGRRHGGAFRLRLSRRPEDGDGREGDLLPASRQEGDVPAIQWNMGTCDDRQGEPRVRQIR